MNNFKSPFMAKDPIKEKQINKYKRVIKKAIGEKANKAQVSAKLRETFPEVKSNKIEVTWSPDGKEVKVYKKN